MRRHALIKSLKLLICLTVLNGCAGLKKFPADKLYEVDFKNQVCGEYKMVDFEKLLFEHTADLPLSACDGVFGFPSNKISPVLNWGRDAIVYGKEKCQ